MLLSIEHFHDLKRTTATLADAVAQQDLTGFDFRAPNSRHRHDACARPVVTYLLDTNVLSELRRPSKADKNVLRAWIQQQILPAYEERIADRHCRRAANRTLSRFGSQTSPCAPSLRSTRSMPSSISRIVMAERKISAFETADAQARTDCDALIAATALVHDMMVVTRNLADFQPMEVRTINPWT